MIAARTRTTKQIVITENDHDRLNEVIESPRYRATHAASLILLRDKLKQGATVSAYDVPKGAVTMHSQMRVRDLRTGEAETYTLVYPDEADINLGRLSVLAPMGIALLGTKVGQVVRFDTPAGTRRLKVMRIVYQPEAMGDLHL